MMKFRKSSWLLILVLCASLTAFGQSVVQQAERQFDLLAYTAAIDLFEQSLKGKIAGADKTRILRKLAYSYRQVRDAPNAERVYRELISSNNGDFSGDDAKVYLYFAQSLASNGKYKESQEAYDKFLKAGGDERGKAFSKLYQDVSVLSKNQASYKIDYLSINTGKADFSPMYYKNGLVFCSGRGEGMGVKRMFNWNGTSFLDLYYLPDMSSLSSKEAAGVGGSGAGRRDAKAPGMVGNDEYTAPTANDSRTVGYYGGARAVNNDGYQENALTPSEKFGSSLNTKYHEGPTAFTSDWNTTIFTRNNFLNGKYRQSSEKINKLKMYTAKAKSDAWTDIKEVPFNSDEYSTGHPAITKDDKMVYFVSDMPGGFGGTDLYVVQFNGGSWGTPVNLGPTINTAGNEMFPFVDEKGHLYFSSDGHPGLGELDMFFVEMNNGAPAGKPRNLGAPLNSPKDDFGLITDGERKIGYFSSNRKRGGHDDDIYRFTREGSLYPCREMTVAVFDAETKMPLDNASVLIEAKDGKTDNKMTDSNGTVKICLDDNKEYSIKASREAYLPNTVGYSTMGDSDDEPSRLDIPLSKPAIDTTQAVSQPQPNPNTYTSSTATDGLPQTKAPDLPCKVTQVKGRITSQRDNSPLEGVVVVLRNECDGTTQSVVTGADGRYVFDICAGCDYTLDANKDGLGVGSKRIRKVSERGAPKVLNTDLSMFGDGDIVELKNIYYDYGKCNIRPDAARELDRLVEIMRKYPNMRIELRSHTDSRSDADFNQKLSTGRAKEAVWYLERKGISSERMIFQGYGETQLLNECADGVPCSEEQHQQNRRTEFKVLQLR
jgi:outer membrane protein OmpA-like peptidoglycan-associated protein/tetratricopeptide (TPR) repeat protein